MSYKSSALQAMYPVYLQGIAERDKRREREYLAKQDAESHREELLKIEQFITQEKKKEADA